MPSNIYILSVCDPWTGREREHPVGATTDEAMLHAMIAAKIMSGDIAYGNKENSWVNFMQDFKEGTIDFQKLIYGSVTSYGDMQITEPLSMSRFPGVADVFEQLSAERAKSEIEKLEIGQRSLIYSVVEVRTDFGYTSFLMPGFCDRDDLESSDAFQEFMARTSDAEINASVYSYSVGIGESVYPDEDELAIIEQYQDVLAEKYDADYIKSDFISFYYEAEPEYDGEER